MRKPTLNESGHSDICPNSLLGHRILLIGSFAAMSRSDAKHLIRLAGGNICHGVEGSHSILVKGINAIGAEVKGALIHSAEILTEGQFLKRVGAISHLESLRKEATDIHTAQDRLYELASVVPEAVVASPIWEKLFRKDSEFIVSLPGDFKLRMLWTTTST